MYAKHLYLSHTSGCFEGDKPQTIRLGQIFTKRNRQSAVKNFCEVQLSCEATNLAKTMDTFFH